MKTVELRAAAKKPGKSHGRFAPLFGRVENQQHSLGYVRGLLLAEGRKSVEPMALLFGGPAFQTPAIEQATVLAWQRFLTAAQWEADMVQREIHAEEDTPLEVMGQVSGCRWRVEEFFEDGKTHLGMSDYEARSWTSWHHHMCLVALAHLFITQTRRDAKSQIPDLTLDMALRIVRSAMERPTLTFEDVLELIKYHGKRNRQAQKSHRKSWLDKHKSVRKKVML
jgi:SRSO17 transposase